MTAFTLEVYYECDEDKDFSIAEAGKLRDLVHELAPHIALNVDVQKATDICRSQVDLPDGRHYDVPNQNPSSSGRQSLLITSEDFGLLGLAGPGRGCLNKKLMLEMIGRGGNSANITIHEWLHTIQDQNVNGWNIPPADSSADYGFRDPSGYDHGSPTWHEWYRFALSGMKC
jgi:hypothetical protein